MWHRNSALPNPNFGRNAVSVNTELKTHILNLLLSPTYALIYIIKILSQAITLVALFAPTCFDPYGSSSGSTAGPC